MAPEATCLSTCPSSRRPVSSIEVGCFFLLRFRCGSQVGSVVCEYRSLYSEVFAFPSQVDCSPAIPALPRAQAKKIRSLLLTAILARTTPRSDMYPREESSAWVLMVSRSFGGANCGVESKHALSYAIISSRSRHGCSTVDLGSVISPARSADTQVSAVPQLGTLLSSSQA